MKRFKSISAASKHIIDIETALYQYTIAIIFILRIFHDGILRYEQHEHRLSLIKFLNYILNYIA